MDRAAIAKQAQRQDAITWLIQSGNPHLPIRYAWRAFGVVAAMRVVWARLVRAVISRG